MRALVLVACCLVPSPAFAFMMPHHDLASLALEADVIVRAERVGGPEGAAVYRVERVLAGTGLRRRERITIDHAVYRVASTEGPVIGAPIERAVVLFLVRGAGAREPSWRLVPSGLRVFAAGRAYRFEQWSNPGPYVAVPERREPDDLCRHREDGVHLDRAALERLLDAAIARAGRARTAIAAADRAALLALVPAGQGQCAVSFYEDRVAVRAYEALVAAGDVDGALEIYARIRGLRPFGTSIPDVELLARAEAASSPAARRIAALSLLHLLPSDEVVRRLFAIARDPRAPRDVRIAAIDRIAGWHDVGTSDRSWPERRSRAEVELRALVHDRIERERPSIVSALVAAASRWQLRGVVPRTIPVAVSARADGRAVVYRAAAAPGADVRSVRAEASPACELASSSSGARGWDGRFEVCEGRTEIVFTILRGGTQTTLRAPIER